jgi:hypothetical protein
MYLIGIFASPIPYLAILGIYLSGFAYIKFWTAQVEEEISRDALPAEVIPFSELALKDEATLWVDDFQESHALPPGESLVPLIDFTCYRIPVFDHSPSHFFWPLQHRARPPPVG